VLIAADHRHLGTRRGPQKTGCDSCRYSPGMELDTTKLETIAANLADFGASLADRRTSANPALWKDMGAAFGGIAEAIKEIAVVSKVPAARPREAPDAHQCRI
jgi:hypothetical protein